MRAGRWLCLVLGAAWLGAESASAVVGCETASGKLKLRPEACKPGKESVTFDTGADPAGVWRWTSGPPLAGSADTFTEYVVLSPDGSGRVHRRQRFAGTLDCRPLNYARSLSAALVLDVSNAGVAEVWRGRLTAPDALELSDASGATTQLERESAVDAAFECVELQENRRFAGLPAPSSFSGLAFDGTQLWYSVGDALHAQPVDPGTGAAGTQVDLGPAWSHVHAMQGADFWVHCGCGGTADASRIVAPGGALVDEVKTAGLGGPISLGALARDEINAVLFVFGFSFEGGTYRLLQVRSDPEPDELLASVDVGFYLAAIAWDGSALWGLQNDKLFRIDSTGNATATYALPDPSVSWQGVAFANGELFALGRSNDNEAVIVSLAP